MNPRLLLRVFGLPATLEYLCARTGWRPESWTFVARSRHRAQTARCAVGVRPVGSRP